MTKARGLLIVGLLLCATPSLADPIDLSFEGGTLTDTGWESMGLVSVTGGLAFPPIAPLAGEGAFALLDSGDPLFTDDSASAADLAAFLGTDLSAYSGGSALRGSWDLNAGDRWTFWFNFVTTEPDGLQCENFTVVCNDAALFVQTSAGTLVRQEILGDRSVVGGFGTTGWQQFEFTAETAGTYVIGMGVFNHPSTDEISSSYLAVDKFEVLSLGEVPPPPGPVDVPEPSTLLLLTAGWGTAFVSRRFVGAPKERRRLRTL